MNGSSRCLTSIFEVIGSTLAITYALLVASNTGNIWAVRSGCPAATP